MADKVGYTLIPEKYPITLLVNEGDISPNAPPDSEELTKKRMEMMRRIDDKFAKADAEDWYSLVVAFRFPDQYPDTYNVHDEAWLITELTVTPEGVSLEFNGNMVTLKPCTDEEWIEWYAPGKTVADYMREIHGVRIELPQGTDLAIKRPRKLDIPTSQETNAFFQSQTDGKRQENWKSNEDQDALIWDGNLPHKVILPLTEQEKDIESLIDLSKAQDADSCFIAITILNTLKPDGPLPDGLRRGEWIDLLNVAKDNNILTYESKELREAAIRKVWHTLLYGAKAQVCGHRTKTYYHKKTKETIGTEIRSPLWTFGGKERQAQGVLFDAIEIPLRVEVILTKAWEKMLFDENLAQYLPCGEKISKQITAGQPSSAWARVIGLALWFKWRLDPQKTLLAYANATLQTNAPADEETFNKLEKIGTDYKHAGVLKITRRDVLCKYTPAKAPPSELINNPKLVKEYWTKAMKILYRQGIIEKSGEAIRTVDDITRKLPRYNNLDTWLDEVIDIRPGPDIMPAIEEQASKKPKPKPRALKPAPRKKK